MVPCPLEEYSDKAKEIVKNRLKASIHRGDLGFEDKNKGNMLKTSEWTMSLGCENVRVWTRKPVTEQ